MANKVSTVSYKQEYEPDVLEVVNQLAVLEQRKPHDSIRRLILEAGRARIARLKAVSQEENYPDSQGGGRSVENESAELTQSGSVPD